MSPRNNCGHPPRRPGAAAARAVHQGKPAALGWSAWRTAAQGMQTLRPALVRGCLPRNRRDPSVSRPSLPRPPCFPRLVRPPRAVAPGGRLRPGAGPVNPQTATGPQSQTPASPRVRLRQAPTPLIAAGPEARAAKTLVRASIFRGVAFLTPKRALVRKFVNLFWHPSGTPIPAPVPMPLDLPPLPPGLRPSSRGGRRGRRPRRPAAAEPPRRRPRPAPELARPRPAPPRRRADPVRAAAPDAATPTPPDAPKPRPLRADPALPRPTVAARPGRRFPARPPGAAPPEPPGPRPSRPRRAPPRRWNSARRSPKEARTRRRPCA
jgi:hypothetical protein